MSKALKQPRRKRRALRYIIGELLACDCGCVDFDCSGGTRWGDESKWVYATCLNCGEPAKLVHEIPASAFRLTDKAKMTMDNEG